MAFPVPRFSAVPLADLIDGCLGGTLAARGFARGALIGAWSEIVGETLAARCAPARIDWPRRGAVDANGQPQTAALIIRVESAFALELQHLAPLVMERVNAHLGWRCIGRIALRQGPLAKPPARPAPAVLDAAAASALNARVADVADEPLRAALARLGAGVLARPGKG